MDPIPESPPVPQSILLIVGPILIGTFFSYLLLGVVFVQVYIYYMSFPNDKLAIKLIVYTLLLLDVLQTISISASAWNFMSSGWGRQENLFLTDWGFAFIPFFCGVCSVVVQLFFSWRIYVLGSHMTGIRRKIFRLIIPAIVATAFMQGISSIVTTVRWYFISDTRRFHEINNEVSVWLAGSAAADILVTMSMIYLLHVARTNARQFNTGKGTDVLLTRLIRFSVETGLITASSAIADLIFFLLLTQTSLHLAFSLWLSKMYTNTLYASLNSRARFQRDDRAQLASGQTGTASITIRSEVTGSSKAQKDPYTATQTQNSANFISFDNDSTEEQLKNNRPRSLDNERSMIPMVSIVKETFRDRP